MSEKTIGKELRSNPQWKNSKWLLQESGKLTPMCLSARALVEKPRATISEKQAFSFQLLSFPWAWRPCLNWTRKRPLWWGSKRAIMPEERFIKRLERMPKGKHTSNSTLPRVRNLRKKEPMWKDFLDCLHKSKGILIQLCGSLLDDLNPKTKKRQGTIKEGLRNGWTVNVPCLTRDSHPPTSVHTTGKNWDFLVAYELPRVSVHVRAA